MVLYPNNNFKVMIDDEVKAEGHLEDHFDMPVPRLIKDRYAFKPKEWVDDAEIDDPDDRQPEDWVTDQWIPDPDAVKPHDWIEEEDGEYEPP